MSITNKLIPVPFANSASSTWKYSIPETLSSTDPTNKACYDVGFPAVTMTDIAAGGIPFYGQDVNGVLNDITTAIRYMQSGNYQTYNAEFATAIGGYSKGAVIKGSDGNSYQSTVDANITDPTEGDNWVLYESLLLTGGTVTGDTNFTGKLQKNGIDLVYITESYKSADGKSWYRKWSDGFIEQGGWVTSIKSSYTIVNLLKSFTTVGYQVQVTLSNDGEYDKSLYGLTIITDERTFSTFSVFVKNNSNVQSTQPCNWYVCGY